MMTMKVVVVAALAASSIATVPSLLLSPPPPLPILPSSTLSICFPCCQGSNSLTESSKLESYTKFQSNLAYFLQLDTFPNGTHSKSVMGAFYVPPAHKSANCVKLALATITISLGSQTQYYRQRSRSLITFVKPDVRRVLFTWHLDTIKLEVNKDF